jgi:RNA polymerase-binding transcription factor DksA
MISPRPGKPSAAAGAPSPSVGSVPDEDRARLLDAIEIDLADVELALARLEAGTYETCERCAAAIGDDVLVVTPAARRCATCTDAPA